MIYLIYSVDHLSNVRDNSENSHAKDLTNMYFLLLTFRRGLKSYIYMVGINEASLLLRHEYHTLVR